ncbi:MAG TPA: alkaline phosphatase family protein [Bryobacteraceae bacterium]|nr:alkaline phosphatase family protein [Bryobacteraceae bacterium]
MRNLISALCAAIALLNSVGRAQTAKEAPRPKLVLLVAIDQFRYDYLARFRSEYKGGLDRLLTRGAVFVNANLEHYPTVTAIGHSTMLTGATPAISGIIGNDWYERESKKNVTSVSDDAVRLLGGAESSGASPRRLLVSTVGDELKRSGHGASKVIGLSLKDRSAILPSGHMADAAYWYDSKAGNFVSSTYYFQDLPDWVKAFNARRLPDKYAGLEWSYPEAVMKLPSEAGPKLSGAVYSSPYGNELLEAFAEEAIRHEKLGQRDATDLLTISFSSNDAVGHALGPDAPQVHDICVRTDRVLGKLFSFIDETIGRDQVLVALTADHGVMPLPERLARDRMPGGRLSGADLFGEIKRGLSERFGPGDWVVGTAGTSPYLNWDLIKTRGLKAAEVEDAAAAIAQSLPHVARVYTRHNLLAGNVTPDRISARVARSFNARRSGDLEIILDPYWIRGNTGTTHGTPYSYDAHIPLILMGPGIRPGRYAEPVALNDLAPTLATLLDIETPSGSVGRALYEALSAQPAAPAVFSGTL